MIAATNRDLEREVAGGRFREDLYYRLKVVTLEIPPLRDRTSDLPVLCEHFLRAFSEEHGKSEIRISPQALDALARHPWPGNVRELRNVLESVVIFHPGGEIKVEELPAQFRDAARSTKSAAPIQTPFGTPRTMEEIERRGDPGDARTHARAARREPRASSASDCARCSASSRTTERRGSWRGLIRWTYRP